MLRCLFYQLYKCNTFSVSSLRFGFNHERMLDFFQILFRHLLGWSCFLTVYSFNKVNYVIGSHMVDQLCTPEINCTWSWCINLILCFQASNFSSIFCRMFVHLLFYVYIYSHTMSLGRYSIAYWNLFQGLLAVTIKTAFVILYSKSLMLLFKSVLLFIMTIT